MKTNNLASVKVVNYGQLLPANIDVKLSEDNLSHDLLNTTAPICWSCKSLCKEAYTTNHPCTICSECRDKCLQDLEEGKEVNCPCEATCENIKIEKDQLQSQNFLYAKKFNAIKFFCPNKVYGCDIQLSFDKIVEHVGDSCLFAQIPCKFCGENVTKCLLDEHEKKLCESRIVECDLCSLKILFKDLNSSHKDIRSENCCKKFFDTCPYCQDVNLTRDEFEGHLKDCTAKPRCCSFKDAGCDFFNTDLKVEEHETSFQLQHQKMMMMRLSQLTVENDKLKKQIRVQRENDFLMQQLLDQKDNNLTKSISTTKEEFKKENEKLKSQLLERMEVNKMTLVTIKQELNDKIDSTQSLINQRLWILEKVDIKKFVAICKDKEIDSPTFETGSPGYKFRLQLFLNGHGLNKNTHVSLFFQLVRGDHDKLLHWPCKLKFVVELVKLSKINEISPARFTICWATEDSEDKKLLNKPKDDENDAFGCEQLLTQKEAFTGDYRRGDKMLFRVTFK